MRFERASLTAASVLVAVLIGCAGPIAQPNEEPAAEESTDMSTLRHHEINYIEFTVLDMAEAQRFYNAAFGWEFNDYGPEYAGIRRGEGEAGGLRQDAAVTPGGPLVILYSEDLERSVEQVREAGGRITEEPYAFPGGRRFHFADPSGNVLAVWSDK